MFAKFRRALSGKVIAASAASLALVAGLVPAPAMAQYQQEIRNDMSRCRAGTPSIRVNVSGIEAASGTVRVQLYRGIENEWLQRGKWLYRIEAPARAGAMSFCLPVPEAGQYAVAVRHDINGNGSTDITTDGGAMSNNPSINIFNLGRPSVNRTRFAVGSDMVTLNLNMRYM
jgi:uncharacterized protein (DUF2141 family)